MLLIYWIKDFSIYWQQLLSSDDLIDTVVKYDNHTVYNAYMTAIAWYLWWNDAYTACKDYSINT